MVGKVRPVRWKLEELRMLFCTLKTCQRYLQSQLKLKSVNSVLLLVFLIINCYTMGKQRLVNCYVSLEDI